MSLSIVLMLISLPLLLGCSAFFSGSETALFSLSRHQRKQFERAESVTGHTITRLLAQTRSLLITLLLGNMVANVLYINIATLMLLQLGRSRDISPIVTAVLNLVPLLALILLGEVVPKMIAARTTARWSQIIALPMWFVHCALAPVRVFFSWLIITPLSRLIAPSQGVPELSPAEMESLLALSEKHGVIDSEEENLLQQVLELGQLKVRDLMTPRVDIQAFDLRDNPDDLLRLIHQTRLRHIPVYDRDLDNLVGLIFSRQLLVRPPQTRADVRKLIRQVTFVPEQQRADRLLVDLRKSGTALAMVVDEYGGTAGLITIEDIAEQVVGEIPGAYETAAGPRVQPVGEHRWRVAGDLSVREWIEAFLPGGAGAATAQMQMVSTVAGLVMAQLGRLPRQGEVIRVGNLQMTVERLERRRIQSVLIELIKQPPANRTKDQR